MQTKNTAATDAKLLIRLAIVVLTATPLQAQTQEGASSATRRPTALNATQVQQVNSQARFHQIDLGKLDPAEPVSLGITLSNTETIARPLKEVVVSCGCVAVTKGALSLDPGNTRLEFKVTPSTKAGTHRESIQFVYRDTDETSSDETTVLLTYLSKPRVAVEFERGAWEVDATERRTLTRVIVLRSDVRDDLSSIVAATSRTDIALTVKDVRREDESFVREVVVKLTSGGNRSIQLPRHFSIHLKDSHRDKAIASVPMVAVAAVEVDITAIRQEGVLAIYSRFSKPQSAPPQIEIDIVDGSTGRKKAVKAVRLNSRLYRSELPGGLNDALANALFRISTGANRESTYEFPLARYAED